MDNVVPSPMSLELEFELDSAGHWVSRAWSAVAAVPSPPVAATRRLGGTGRPAS